ncbi:MAG: hypothetical protein ACREH9_05455 [Pseudomonadota bacterium]
MTPEQRAEMQPFVDQMMKNLQEKRKAALALSAAPSQATQVLPASPDRPPAAK